MPRLIDADEAYKVLTDYYHQRTEIQHKALTEALSRVPTVDAVLTEFHDRCMEIEIQKRFELELKEKHGHWKWHEDNREWFCSECKRFVYGVSLEVYSGEYKFCPHCGARMDEVEDGS